MDNMEEDGFNYKNRTLPALNQVNQNRVDLKTVHLIGIYVCLT